VDRFGATEAIAKQLMRNGFVSRYAPKSGVDGLDGAAEGAFLLCSLWLADNWVIQGDHDKAKALFERLLSLHNDVGLLAEEVRPQGPALAGQFSPGILSRRAGKIPPIICCGRKDRPNIAPARNGDHRG
jgi:GH15 family glucan-1,4-alpha-glucosidase